MQSSTILYKDRKKSKFLRFPNILLAELRFYTEPSVFLIAAHRRFRESWQAEIRTRDLSSGSNRYYYTFSSTKLQFQRTSSVYPRSGWNHCPVPQCSPEELLLFRKGEKLVAKRRHSKTSLYKNKT